MEERGNTERPPTLRNRCERCAAAVKKPRCFGGTEEYRREETRKYRERTEALRTFLERFLSLSKDAAVNFYWPRIRTNYDRFAFRSDFTS